MGTRTEKPLWGFGVTGWVLLPVALALGAAWITGYDLRFQLMSLIIDVWGWPGLVRFVTAVLPAHHFAVQAPEFSPVSLAYVLAAMQVYPRRLGWWWYVAVVAAAVGAPLLGWATPRWWLAWGSALGSPGFLCTAKWLGAAAVLGLLWAMTGRLWTGVALCAVMGTSIAMSGWLLQNRALGPVELWVAQWPAPIVWHLALGGVLLGWAVRERRATRPPWECPACGYDLRGCGAAICPECGACSAPLIRGGVSSPHAPAP